MWLLITRPQKLQLYTTDYTRVQLLLEAIHHPTTASSCHRLTTEKASNNHFSPHDNISILLAGIAFRLSFILITSREKITFEKRFQLLFPDSFPVSDVCQAGNFSVQRPISPIHTSTTIHRARALIAFEVKYKSTLHTPRIGWQFDKALKFLDPAKTINRLVSRARLAVNCKFL